MSNDDYTDFEVIQLLKAAYGIEMSADFDAIRYKPVNYDKTQLKLAEDITAAAGRTNYKMASGAGVVLVILHFREMEYSAVKFQKYHWIIVAARALLANLTNAQ